MTIRLLHRPPSVRKDVTDEADPEFSPELVDDEAELRDTFGESVLWLRGYVPAALAAGVTLDALGRLDWERFHEKLAQIAAPMSQTAERTAAVTVQGLAPDVPRDNTFPLARRAAADSAAKLVVQVSDTTRQQLADAIQRGLAEGWSVPRATREIRGMIGLHDQWANAVSNMYQGNILSGMDESRAGKLADQYYERLLTSRATTIARTELLDASNRGRMAGWQQAAGAGVFDPATATKRWIVGDSPCDICDGLDGEEVAWDDTFSSGDDMPPAHPRCRCTAILENVEQPSADADPAETLGPSEDEVDLGEPIAASRFIKYSDDQPRDDHGRFGSGGEARTMVEHYGIPEQSTSAMTQWQLGKAMREDPRWSGWVSGLSDDEMSAIRGYRDYSQSINGYLRGSAGSEFLSDEMKQDYEEQASRVSSAVQQSPGLEHDTLLYRVGELPPGLAVGDTFQDRGFVSTSMDHEMSKQFGGAAPMEIVAPAGTKTAYVDGVLSATGGGLPEYEMLLDRGTTFRLTGRGEHGGPKLEVVNP